MRLIAPLTMVLVALFSGAEEAIVIEVGTGEVPSIAAAWALVVERHAADGLPEAGVRIRLLEGDHVVTGPARISRPEGASPMPPVIIEPAEGAAVRLLGGKAVRDFHPVDDEAVRARLKEDARPHVVAANLNALGISDFGKLRARGFGRAKQPSALEVFFNGDPLTVARWPNDGWAHIAGVPEGEEGVFLYDEAAPVARWAEPEKAWVHGYWTWPWADSHEHIRAVDTEQRAIHTHEPHGVYGYKPGRRYYAYNILEELDAPGEYYLDAASGMLYFWPPEEMEEAEVLVSLLEAPFVTIENMHDVTVRGLTFAAARGGGVVFRGGRNVRVEDVTFANLGTFAVSIAPYTQGDTVVQPVQCGVARCTIYNTGEGGINIDAGDRQTLSPGACFADDNHIRNYSRWVRTYRSAIQLSGVRNRAAHNHIHDAPHMAIGYGGNEHIVEFNHIHHVCLETGDAGATYIGRDWTHRKNIVRYNYFHDLGDGAGHDGGFSDVQAIYLDDFICDTLVYGNIVVGAGRGVLIGGGRDNTVDNNIFVNCNVGVHIDQRGLGWASYYFDGGYNTLFERFDAVNAGEPPYSLRYPPLVTLQDDEPAAAKYNQVVRNVFVNCGDNLNLANGLDDTQVAIADNWTGDDPGFAPGTHRLQDQSPVYALGFQPIPWAQIGPRK